MRCSAFTLNVLTKWQNGVERWHRHSWRFRDDDEFVDWWRDGEECFTKPLMHCLFHRQFVQRNRLMQFTNVWDRWNPCALWYVLRKNLVTFDKILCHFVVTDNHDVRHFFPNLFQFVLYCVVSIDPYLSVESFWKVEDIVLQRQWFRRTVRADAWWWHS